VRLISATNQDPERAIRDGTFRQDLFFRLNVIPLKLPPLRSRIEDLPALAQHFLRVYSGQYERGNLRLSAEALRVLRGYSWPGNVRELQNVVERMVSLAAPGEEIPADELPEELTSPRGEPARYMVVADRPYHDAKAEAISVFEKEYLRDLLVRNDGNISRAARQAGMDRKTIHRMLSKYDLEAH
jgi:DNA-binding NtrC family response regulator